MAAFMRNIRFLATKEYRRWNLVGKCENARKKCTTYWTIVKFNTKCDTEKKILSQIRKLDWLDFNSNPPSVRRIYRAQISTETKQREISSYSNSWYYTHRQLGNEEKMLMKIVALTAALALHLGTEVEAGFRCSLGSYAHPNWACSASCVVVGQTSGNCDPAGVCQ